MSINRKSIWIASAGLVLGVAAVAYARRKNYAPLPVAPHVDLNRYMGEWYEIAHFPESFEKDTYGTKANYTLRDDGSVEVLNTSHKGSLTGELKTARGKATVADATTNAKLEVTFAWPFKGDYWILDVDDNYQHALVGVPSRDSLWILSRTAKINLETLQLLTAKAQELGFDTSRFIYTSQSGRQVRAVSA
ncbi:MAG: lipocalin family protein [Bacteroidota bacterium]